MAAYPAMGGRSVAAAGGGLGQPSWGGERYFFQNSGWGPLSDPIREVFFAHGDTNDNRPAGCSGSIVPAAPANEGGWNNKGNDWCPFFNCQKFPGIGYMEASEQCEPVCNALANGSGLGGSAKLSFKVGCMYVCGNCFSGN